VASRSAVHPCTVRPATVEDLPVVVGLLEAASLPTTELGRTAVWVAEDADGVCGVVGLQGLDGEGLLRSVAVDPGRRGQLIGRLLVDHALEEAGRRLLRTVYALAEGEAAAWLTRRGFTQIDRSQTPPALAASALYQRDCGPDTPLLRFDLPR
jgi:N-acetylglutamate synthase-like GNAT family acetyltransferase